jgi:non-canonical purine NTP pyrophosphatase (RdgB/HAM1 family)
MDTVTFITGNANKAKRLKEYLKIEMLHKAVDLPEIQSLNIREVVEHKVREAYKYVQGPVLVEDVGLQFFALGELPGPLIKWFLKSIDNPGLCKLLDQHADRSAAAHVCFGLYDGTNTHFFENTKLGSIALEPRGVTKFGWDPVFIPEGAQKTYGEMTEAEAVPFSMRRPALAKLEEFLSLNY